MSKKSRRLKAVKVEAATDEENESNLKVLNGGAKHKRRRKKDVEIVPRNMKQSELIRLLNINNNHIVFATGPAGTGKTLISTLYAIRRFKEGSIDKIVITRPAVSVDEQHGFLPGTLIEKMTPWTKPIMDVFEEYYSPKELKYLLCNKCNSSNVVDTGKGAASIISSCLLSSNTASALYLPGE